MHQRDEKLARFGVLKKCSSGDDELEVLRNVQFERLDGHL